MILLLRISGDYVDHANTMDSYIFIFTLKYDLFSMYDVTRVNSLLNYHRFLK